MLSYSIGSLHFEVDCCYTGSFLLNNYKQATNIISLYTPEFEQFKEATGFDDDDFNKWPAEELIYLQNL